MSTIQHVGSRGRKSEFQGHSRYYDKFYEFQATLGLETYKRKKEREWERVERGRGKGDKEINIFVHMYVGKYICIYLYLS